MEKKRWKAVFLDRDGVINEEVDHLNNAANLRILPGVAPAIRALNEKNYRVIVISNQSAVAKGMATEGVVQEINAKIKASLAHDGAHIDAIYYCPHHPEGSVKEYAIVCDCRKPGVGMIQQAAKEHDIDLRGSFLIGDKTSDILAGKRTGLTTILVRTGYAGKDGAHKVIPDLVADDLVAAAARIPEISS